MAQNLAAIAQQYFTRFQDFSLDIETFCVDKNLRTIYVIPCFKEPDIIATLKSLLACDKPKYPILILIFINASENASKEIKDFNLNTYNEVKSFISKNQSEQIQFELRINNELPKKHAGVGYARKTLMDTALKIFARNHSDGIIVNTDADCFFTPNYFRSIENTFEDNSIELAVMHYEHRIAEESNAILAKGLTEYELHLRYYKQALEWTAYPNVLETIGSCMVCLASVYALEGGMNKRKAGEDFYFINKLAKSRTSTTITEATVMPSCRTSDRVPFGTGKAMNDYIKNETKILQSYDIECFIALKQLIEQIEVLYKKGYKQLELDQTGKSFLEKISIEEKIDDIKKQSNNLERFTDRFFYWFDHLKALQFIHHYTQNRYKKLDINIAASEFLNLRSLKKESNSTIDILEAYRKQEKQNA